MASGPAGPAVPTAVHDVDRSIPGHSLPNRRPAHQHPDAVNPRHLRLPDGRVPRPHGHGRRPLRPPEPADHQRGPVRDRLGGRRVHERPDDDDRVACRPGYRRRDADVGHLRPDLNNLPGRQAARRRDRHPGDLGTQLLVASPGRLLRRSQRRRRHRRSDRRSQSGAGRHSPSPRPADRVDRSRNRHNGASGGRGSHGINRS